MHERGGEVETSVEACGGLFGHRTREHWVERGQVPTMVGDLRWHGGEMSPVGSSTSDDPSASTSPSPARSFRAVLALTAWRLLDDG